MKLEDSPSLQDRIRKESQRYITAEPSPDEFTVQDFIDGNDLKDRNVAIRALQRMEADGKIYKRKGRLNGSSCNVYGFTE